MSRCGTICYAIRALKAIKFYRATSRGCILCYAKTCHESVYEIYGVLCAKIEKKPF